MVNPQTGPTSRALLTTASRLWQRSWNEYLSGVRALGMLPTTAARVLIDGQHRDILWRALRTAKKRLLVTSDQLGPEVVDGRFPQSNRGAAELRRTRRARLSTVVESHGYHLL